MSIGTYVNRIELLLHVVCSKEIEGGCKFQQQVIFETEERSRTNDCRFGEDAARNKLTTALLNALGRQSLTTAFLHFIPLWRRIPSWRLGLRCARRRGYNDLRRTLQLPQQFFLFLQYGHPPKRSFYNQISIVMHVRSGVAYFVG